MYLLCRVLGEGGEVRTCRADWLHGELGRPCPIKPGPSSSLEAKMQKSTTIILLMVSLNCASTAAGALTMSVVTAGGADTSVSVAPGGSLSVDLRLDIQDVAIVAAQCRLVAGTANILDVTGGSYNGTDWDTGLMALNIEPGGLDPLGQGFVGSGPLNESIGPAVVTVLATVHLVVDAAAPTGSYTLNVTEIVAGDTSFVDIGGVPGPDFTVVVTGSTPPGGGGTTPPDDGGTTPPDDGGTTPPDDGGTTPPDDGGTNPPDDGGTTPPDDGTTPPPAGGDTTPVFSPRCGAGMVESLALSLTVLLVSHHRRREV